MAIPSKSAISTLALVLLSEGEPIRLRCSQKSIRITKYISW